MSRADLIEIGIAILLVLLNGWFVLAEFALVRVRKTRLEELAAEGNRRARLALTILSRLDRYLAADQLGITLTSLALGWIGEPAIARAIEPLFASLPGSPAIVHGVAIALAFLSITFLHVVLGEQVPKLVAIQEPEAISLSVARPLHWFYIFTYPFMIFLTRSSEWLGRLAGLRAIPDGEAYSQEELRMIIQASHRRGVLGESTRELMQNVFDYESRLASDLMTRRRDVVSIDAAMPVEQAVSIAIEKQYTRYPLLGDAERVIGFVHVRDLILVATGRRRVTTLTDIARQPIFVPGSVPADRVRRQLQAKRIHFGIVVDEFGTFIGIITLEDLLEQIVGDIQDEQDAEPQEFLRRPDGTLELDGGILLDRARNLGLDLPDDDPSVRTLGGYVFLRLGRAPSIGDQLPLGRHRLEVLSLDGIRIRRLRATETKEAKEAKEVTLPGGKSSE